MSVSGKGFKNQIVTIDAVTRRIEQGLGYAAIANDPEVDADGTLDLLLRTPDAPPIAGTFQALYGAQSTWELFEGADIADPGTLLTPMNFNRTPPVRPAVTGTFQNPVINDPGDPLFPQIILPGGTTGQNTAGGVSETLFFVLAPSTDYIFRLTNLGTTDTAMTIFGIFVEIVGPLSSGT